MNLEHELGHALRRKQPPNGFDEKVLHRIASGQTVTIPPAQAPRNRLALSTAASLLIILGGSYALQKYEARQAYQHQQAQAEQAARDVVLALQIASEKVSAVQAKVQEMTRHERQVEY
jgi:hypothetical protein